MVLISIFLFSKTGLLSTEDRVSYFETGQEICYIFLKKCYRF